LYFTIIYTTFSMYTILSSTQRFGELCENLFLCFVVQPCIPFVRIAAPSSPSFYGFFIFKERVRGQSTGQRSTEGFATIGCCLFTKVRLQKMRQQFIRLFAFLHVRNFPLLKVKTEVCSEPLMLDISFRHFKACTGQQL